MGFRPLVLALLFAAAAPSARAEVVIDVAAFYYSDSFTYSSTNYTYNRLMWDVCLGAGLGKQSYWVLGWNYDSMTLAENPGTETKLTVTDMGPKLAYYIDKDRAWSISAAYNLITKGSYSSGGAAAVELRGTSIKADLGYMPVIGESLYMGLKISYYKPAFAETVTSTTLTKEANSRTVIYPSFALTYRFN